MKFLLQSILLQHRVHFLNSQSNNKKSVWGINEVHDDDKEF